MKFGAKLKQLRNDAGLTQEELAAKLSLKKQTISQYEKGKREPRHSETITKIAEVFGITTDELLGGVSFQSNPKIVLYGSDGRLVDITMLKEEDQKYILDLADRLGGKEGK